MKNHSKIAIRLITLAMTLAMLLSVIPVTTYANQFDTENYLTRVDILPTGEVSEYGYRPTAAYDEDGNLIEGFEPAKLSLSERASANAYTEALPSAYSSLDVTNSVGAPIVTSVKDQGNSGTCWAFAAISAAETAFLRNNPVEDADYSEGMLAYFGNRCRIIDPSDPTSGDGVNYDDPYNYGGNNYVSGAAMARWTGFEDDLYATDPNWYGNFNGYTYDESLRYIAEQHLITNILIDGQDVNGVKTFIKAFGGVVATYYSISNYYKFGEMTTFYQNVETSLNHAVYIVGWDDSIPASAFGVTPPGDGAWLVKNSWGSWWGDDGYFWLSYYDPSFNYAWVMDFEDADNVDNNYQYDGSWAEGVSFVSGIGDSTDKIECVNFYNAKGNELLKQVGYFNMNKSAELTVKVFLDPTSADPYTGTLVSTQVETVSGQGYRTIRLDNPVVLTPEQNFAVSVTVRSLSGEEARATCEYPKYASEHFTGSSYYKMSFADGAYVKWTKFDSNFIIKAFTEDIDSTNKTLLSELYTAALNRFSEDDIFMVQAKAVLDDETAGKQDVNNAYKRLNYRFNNYGATVGFDPVLPVEEYPEPITYSAGSDIIIPEITPEYEGWAFVGWNESGNGAHYTYAPGEIYRIPGSVTLKAVWIRSDGDGKFPTGGWYTTYYSANGGNWFKGDDRIKQSYTINGVLHKGDLFEFPVLTSDLYRDGYRLQTDGEDMTEAEFWSGDGKGNTTYGDGAANNGYEYEIYENAYKNSVFMVDTDRVPYGTNIFVYAAWDPIITYNMNDGSDVAIQDFNYITKGNEYTVLDAGGYTAYSSSNDLKGTRDADNSNTLMKNRENYDGLTSIPEADILYWNTKADGTGTSYTPGESYDVTEPLTLYAIYEEVVHEHEYMGTMTTMPGCTEAGIMTYTCTCGDSYTETVAALGHAMTAWTVVKEATETEAGLEERTCRRGCGLVETREIPATGTPEVEEPYLSADGPNLTVYNLDDVKDIWIGLGEYTTYRDVKNNAVVQIASTKLGDATEYTYLVKEGGMHTVLIRYNDGTQKFLYIDITVTEPVFTQDGLQLTVSNLTDVKVIRTAYGEYKTVSEIKRGEGARSFTAKNEIKGADAYKIQYRNSGKVTVAVQYNDGYTAIVVLDIQQKTPTVVQEGNVVTFGDLDGLYNIRYAMGEYTTASQIKAAAGSMALKSSAIDENGNIVVTLKTAGTYTFCVQYNDESMNFYTIVVE